jgi:NADP-dependent 3-hydroxy acid dehydrogenase YdfG
MPDHADSPVTLITGGTTGIGAATARLLLDAGHRVLVTGRHEAKLDRLASELDAGPALLTVAGDATDYAGLCAAVSDAVDRFGRLDNVVANAGFATHDTLADGDPERWREMVLVNVLAPALLVKAALPALEASSGRIVFIGSVAGLKNTAGNVYSVTKWAVTGLAENTRLMVTGRGIGVTLVAPGRVDTPFWAARSGGLPLDGPALTAADIARSIGWVLAQPADVDVNTVVVRPKGQAV